MCNFSFFESIASLWGEVASGVELKLLNRKIWGSDPHFYGSYSAFPPGFNLADWEELGRREENLLFAGSHTSREFYGFVHGAYLEGKLFELTQSLF